MLVTLSVPLLTTWARWAATVVPSAEAEPASSSVAPVPIVAVTPPPTLAEPEASVRCPPVTDTAELFPKSVAPVTASVPAPVLASDPPPLRDADPERVTDACTVEVPAEIC